MAIRRTHSDACPRTPFFVARERTDMAIELRTLLTRADVAQLLKVSPDRVSQLRRSGELPTIATPLGHLFREEDVEAYRTVREARRAGKSG